AASPRRQLLCHSSPASKDRARPNRGETLPPFPRPLFRSPPLRILQSRLVKQTNYTEPFGSSRGRPRSILISSWWTTSVVPASIVKLWVSGPDSELPIGTGPVLNEPDFE